MAMTPEQKAYIKRELSAMTASKGWFLALQILEDSVKEIEKACFDEEDEAKGAVLRREAKAARKFATLYLAKIEDYKNAELDFNETFNEVADM